MELKLKSLEKFVVIGDRVLIRPETGSDKTESGLYLPPGVSEKEKIQSGYVIKTGPGYPIGSQGEDESWKESKEPIKFIPLQIKEGDLAIFLRKEAFEIEFEKEKFLIVSQAAILMCIRNDDFVF